MNPRLWKTLALVGTAVLACTLLALTARATEGQTQELTPAKAVEPPAERTIDDCMTVTVEELEALGHGTGLPAAASVIEDVPCLMSSQGYMGFQTVAKGKWSAFGWCYNYTPDMSPCLEAYPPLYLCVLPARPTFAGVIRDQCTWLDFWTAHSFDIATRPPNVDFDNYAVIAVVLGERDNCGWFVNIESIQLTDCGVKVRITECLQMGVEDRVVNPYHFVKIPKSCIPFGRNICFDHGRGPEPIEP